MFTLCVRLFNYFHFLFLSLFLSFLLALQYVTCAYIICVLKIFYYFIFKLCLPYYGRVPKMIFPTTNGLLTLQTQGIHYFNFYIFALLIYLYVILPVITTTLIKVLAHSRSLWLVLHQYLENQIF